MSDLALAELGLGNEDRARKLSDASLYRSWTEIEPPSPSHAYALYVRAQIEDQLGNREEAKARAREAIKIYSALGAKYYTIRVSSFLRELEGQRP